MNEHSKDFRQYLTALKDDQLRKMLEQYNEAIERHRADGTGRLVENMGKHRAMIEAELKRRQEGYDAASTMLGGLLGPVRR